MGATNDGDAPPASSTAAAPAETAPPADEAAATTGAQADDSGAEISSSAAANTADAGAPASDAGSGSGPAADEPAPTATATPDGAEASAPPTIDTGAPSTATAPTTPGSNGAAPRKKPVGSPHHQRGVLLSRPARPDEGEPDVEETPLAKVSARLDRVACPGTAVKIAIVREVEPKFVARQLAEMKALLEKQHKEEADAVLTTVDLALDLQAAHSRREDRLDTFHDKELKALSNMATTAVSLEDGPTGLAFDGADVTAAAPGGAGAHGGVLVGMRFLKVGEDDVGEDDDPSGAIGAAAKPVLCVVSLAKFMDATTEAPRIALAFADAGELGIALDGLLVKEVDPDGRAARAGVAAGCAIYSVGGTRFAPDVDTATVEAVLAVRPVEVVFAPLAAAPDAPFAVPPSPKASTPRQEEVRAPLGADGPMAPGADAAAADAAAAATPRPTPTPRKPTILRLRTPRATTKGDAGLAANFRDTPFGRPSANVAKAHMVSSTFGGRVLPLNTPMETLGEMGVGIQLYFFTLRFFFYLFLAISLLYAPQMWLNYGGNDGHAMAEGKVNSDPLGLVVFSLGSQGVDQGTIQDGGCSCASVTETYQGAEIRLAADCEESGGVDCSKDWDTVHVNGAEMQATDVTLVITLFEVLVCLVLLYAFWRYGHHVATIVQQQDDDTASPADYTVIVRHLPPDVTSGEIRDHFSRLYDLTAPEPPPRPASCWAPRVFPTRSLEYTKWGLNPTAVGIIYGFGFAVLFSLSVGPPVAYFIGGQMGAIVSTATAWVVFFGTLAYCRWAKVGSNRVRPTPLAEWQATFAQLKEVRARTKGRSSKVGPAPVGALEAEFAHIPPPVCLPVDDLTHLDDAPHTDKEHYRGSWVADVNVAHPIGHLVKVLQGQTRLNGMVKAGRARIKKCIADVRSAKAEPDGRIRIRKMRRAQASLLGAEARYKAIELRLAQLTARVQKGADPQVMQVCNSAFVTFNHEESQWRCLDDFKHSRSALLRSFQPSPLRFAHPRKKDKQGHPVLYALRVEPAPEPSTVLWENIEVTDGERNRRRAITSVITVLLLLVSFSGILAAAGAKKEVAANTPDMSICQADLPAVFGGAYDAERYSEWTLTRDKEAEAATCADGGVSLQWRTDGGAYANNTGVGILNPITDRPRLRAGAEYQDTPMCDGTCVDPDASDSLCYSLACYEDAWQSFGQPCYSYKATTPLWCYCGAELERLIDDVGPRKAFEEMLNGADADICSDVVKGFATAQSLGIGSVFIVVAINAVLKMVLQGLGTFERHLSESTRATAYTLKLFMSQFFNTGVITLIVNAAYRGDEFAFVRDFYILDGDHTDMTRDWYVSVAAPLVLTMVVNIVAPLAFPIAQCLVIKPLQRLAGKGGCATQNELNDLMEGPGFEYEVAIAAFLVQLLVTLVYMGGVPMMAVVAAVCFWVHWHVHKWFLLRYHKLPITYDGSLMLTFAGLLPYMFVVHISVAAFMLGAPDLLRSEFIHPDAEAAAAPSKYNSAVWAIVGPRIVRSNVFPLFFLLAAFVGLWVAYAAFGRVLVHFLKKVLSVLLCAGAPPPDMKHLHRQSAFTGINSAVMTAAQAKARGKEGGVSKGDRDKGLHPFQTVPGAPARKVCSLSQSIHVSVSVPVGERLGLAFEVSTDFSIHGGLLEVTDVEEGGLADKEGIETQMIIDNIGGEVFFGDQAHLSDALAKGHAEGKAVVVTFTFPLRTWEKIEENIQVFNYSLSSNSKYSDVVQLLKESGFVEPGDEAGADAIAEGDEDAEDDDGAEAAAAPAGPAEGATNVVLAPPASRQGAPAIAAPWLAAADGSRGPTPRAEPAGLVGKRAGSITFPQPPTPLAAALAERAERLSSGGTTPKEGGSGSGTPKG